MTPTATVPEPQGRREHATLVTWLLLTLAVLVPMVVLMRPFAVSVATGGILAVLVHPVFVRVQRWMSARFAGIVVTLGVVVLVVAPLSLLVVVAFRQGAVALAQLSSDDAPTFNELLGSLQRWFPFADALGTPDEFKSMLSTALGSLSQSASEGLFRLVRGVPALILQLVIVVLSTYFLLVDGARMFSWFAGKIPLSVSIRDMLVNSFRVTTNAVVLASVAAAATQSIILLVALLSLEVPAAIFGAGAAFVLAWIPPLGGSPVWIVSAIYLYSQGSPTRAWLMVGIGLLVGVIDNVVRPMVLRGRQEMHPLVSLLAILGGLGLFGLPGLFIGPLLAAMFIAVLDIWPAVASHCGIPVSDSGYAVPDFPMLNNPIKG